MATENKLTTAGPAINGFAAHAQTTSTLLSVDGLTVAYGDQTVVHDVSFELARGQSLALIGESGSGKSTIGKAILENWDFAEIMSQAVGEQEELNRVDDGPPDLRDVVAVAIVMARHASDLPALESLLRDLPVSERMGLTEAKIQTVMGESASEVAALSDALGN